MTVVSPFAEQPAERAAEPADPSALRRYVRLREHRPDGFVIFDFAIGDPSLTCELIMPMAAYREFCASNRVVHLNDAQAAQIDREALKWRYGQAGVSE